jgi:hypothetical protein
MLLFFIFLSSSLESALSDSDHLDIHCERLRLGPEDLWDLILGQNGEFNTNAQVLNTHCFDKKNGECSIRGLICWSQGKEIENLKTRNFHAAVFKMIF